MGVDESDTDFESSLHTGGAKTHVLTVAQMARHTHVQDNHAHGAAPSSSSWGWTVAGSTFVAASAQSGAGAGTQLRSAATTSARATNQQTGNNEPHNNLQPYLTTYIWQRVS